MTAVLEFLCITAFIVVMLAAFSMLELLL